MRASVHGILAVIAVAVVAGCSAPLGSNDVELVYRVAPDPIQVDAARLRLRAAHVQADVTLDAGALIVRVEAPHALAARRVLEWSGELELTTLDPGHVFAGADAHGLALADDRYTGAPADVSAAVLAVRDATDRLVRAGDAAVAVRRAAIATIRPRAAPRAVGTDVFVPIERADADRVRGAGDHAVIVAASTALAPGSAGWLRDDGDAGPVVVVSCGDDLRGYRRARTLVLQLAAGGMTATSLPPLELAAQDEPPTDWALAIASVAVPIVTGLLWLVLLRRFDPARPEPLWLVLATFALGAIAQRIAAPIELHTWAATPYLDHHALARDHAASAFPLSLLACVLVTGLVEEGAKLLATVPAVRHRAFDEPVDGIVYAGAAAIGFAVAENVSYFTIYRLDDLTTVSRSLMTIPGHALLSAVWGYALGQRLVRRSHRLPIAFAIAVLAHAAYDSFLEFEQPDAAYAVNFALAIGFAVMVRRALRIGQVAAGAPPPAGPRSLIAVGSKPGATVGFATMLAAGYLLHLHAAATTHAGDRVTVELLVRGAVLAVVFAAGALAMVRLLPLDVAIDDAGVTYAGGLFGWADIRGVTRRRTSVVLDTTRGPVHIGPATAGAVDRLATRIGARAGQ
jgi:RsiW-degrading membrane proteinase PrsW (M82 family)